jgi:hypothetical protein
MRLFAPTKERTKILFTPKASKRDEDSNQYQKRCCNTK